MWTTWCWSSLPYFSQLVVDPLQNYSSTPYPYFFLWLWIEKSNESPDINGELDCSGSGVFYVPQSHYTLQLWVLKRIRIVLLPPGPVSSPFPIILSVSHLYTSRLSIPVFQFVCVCLYLSVCLSVCLSLSLCLSLFVCDLGPLSLFQLSTCTFLGKIIRPTVH